MNETTARLIERYRGYAEALARDIAADLPAHVDRDDLLASAMTGLVEAASRFDPARGAHFKTYAYYRIRGSVFDELARMGGVRQQAVGSQVDAALDDLTESHPSDDPEALIEQIDRVLGRIAAATVLLGIQDAPIECESLESDPLHTAGLDEWRIRLADAMTGLPPDEQTILQMHYFQHATLTECAAQLGKHKAWISRLHARALDRLRDALAGFDLHVPEDGAPEADMPCAVTG
jgi:RNA polymerase sigma factor for flagellar operon FliA